MKRSYDDVAVDNERIVNLELDQNIDDFSPNKRVLSNTEEVLNTEDSVSDSITHNNSLDNNSLDNNSLDNNSLDIDEPLNIDNPEDVPELDWMRRDIIRSSFALIRRSNIFNWDTYDDFSWMGLRDTCVIHNNEDVAVECELYVSLRKTPETTYCSINYILNDDNGKQTMELEWPTLFDDPPTLTIRFNWVESCLFLFSRNRCEEILFDVHDTPSYHWCYFPDVRMHLYRISP